MDIITICSRYNRQMIWAGLAIRRVAEMWVVVLIRQIAWGYEARIGRL